MFTEKAPNRRAAVSVAPVGITGTSVFARWQLQLPAFRAKRKVLPADKPYYLELKPGGTDVVLSLAHTLLSRKKNRQF